MVTGSVCEENLGNIFFLLLTSAVQQGAHQVLVLAGTFLVVSFVIT